MKKNSPTIQGRLYPGLTIVTQTSEYRLVGYSEKGIMRLERDGKELKLIAIYPDRYEAFMAAKTWSDDPEGSLQGFNAHGKRTCLLRKDQVKKDQVLVNPEGHMSTLIMGIRY